MTEPDKYDQRAKVIFKRATEFRSSVNDPTPHEIIAQALRESAAEAFDEAWKIIDDGITTNRWRPDMAASCRDRAIHLRTQNKTDAEEK